MTALPCCSCVDSLLFLALALGSGAVARMPAQEARAAEESAPPLRLFELRRYQTQPGQRDRLVEMFERDFLDAYEAGGTRVLATFRDLDDPDLWVWIRAFPDGKQRGPALSRFYTGETWKTGSDACNATIAGVHEALLLRQPGNAALEVPRSALPPKGAAAKEAAGASAALLVATIYTLEEREEDSFQDFYAAEIGPVLAQLGARPFLTLLTDRSPNTYPGQPVSRETVFVTLTRFESEAAHAAFAAAQRESEAWRERVQEELELRIQGPPEVLRLRPTSRSWLR